MNAYDFIIVGGGTSGTVTAEKLIKNGHHKNTDCEPYCYTFKVVIHFFTFICNR